MGTLFGIAIGIVLGGFVVAFIAGAKISERVAEAFEAGRKIGEAESELMARLGDCPEEVEAAEDKPRDFAHEISALGLARGYGWDANPWVWVVEFRRVEP